MPSFKAVVNGIASTGALYVTVDTTSWIPSDLGCTIASVDVGGPVPIGVYVEPQALTLFPLETLEQFELNETIKISWRAEANIMVNLKIRHA